MLTAPLPLDESERLRALQRLDVLDSAPEREFDAFVASESRFRTLSESSPLGVFAIVATGACTCTNAG
jgi:hypothetical protein